MINHSHKELKDSHSLVWALMAKGVNHGHNEVKKKKNNWKTAGKKLAEPKPDNGCL